MVRNRRALSLALTAGALLLAPAAAHAATLTNAGGTLTYSAAAGKVNRVSFSSADTGNTVFVFRSGGGGGDDDPITPTGCTPLGGGDTSFECLNVSVVNANVSDLGDSVSASLNAGISATLSGGSGDDGVFGQLNVTLNGDDGEDFLSGGDGSQVLNGGNGDDSLNGGGGADQIRGGAGIDSTDYSSFSDPSATPPTVAQDISVTLDGLANDGLTGENDNVTEVEDVFASSCEASDPSTGDCTTPRNVRLVGDGGTNSIGVSEGRGDIDGGAGNDSLFGGENDDTLRARDGFADRVSCGAGNDTAIVDQFDQVSGTCENVQSAAVGNANEDRPPTVSFATPAQGAKLGTAAPNTLTATAADDKGVAKVQFLDDERIVCEDTAAPYTCAYSPRGEDVGRNTLVAVAIDTSQQTASAVRSVTVDRFASKVSRKVTPKKDKRGPFSFKATGRVTKSAAVSNALGCKGTVAVQVKAGSKTISNRRVKVKKNCTYSQKVTFKNRKRFSKNGKLKFTARFSGNGVLKASKSKSATTNTK
jgi:Ca2+-binding RTX toxin-like protein